ncbi:hypothetical protein PR202_gb14582 [Eleusine coracana subsp. coracana]|uniref:DUF6469 domain-containing protein n=1 Tax=Eleusine coracana subsp. coracana TaxID=191504 RepID=A0AAV5EVZ5_ELECO|nr:hypothetical protein PR202_gb14582 [Eleusine coracana subsp. coracana]
MIGRGGAGGSGVQRKNAGQEWPNLVDVILSWSLQDVMNEGLFKDKVVEAEMSSSLESLSTIPFVKISWIEQKKGNGRYEIYVDACPQKAKSSNKAECHAPSVGDIVILSDVKLGHISDITRNGRPYRIAFITGGGDEDDDSPPAKYVIIASGKIDAADRKVQGGKRTSLFAAYLLNPQCNAIVAVAILALSGALRAQERQKQSVCYYG